MLASKLGMTSLGQVDYLVVGAGVAGLRAAVELADHGQVLVITKESVAESNTHYAQGGIAVAMEGEQDVSLHLDDTIAAGDGLVYRAAAEELVREGPLRVEELIAWGAHFDREGTRLLRTREAAHSRPRILHANGDATGAEISRSLATVSRTHASIRFAEWTTVTGLIRHDARVAGVQLLDRTGRLSAVSARSVLLASGGAGQVYSDTTNPAVATGDGIAAAYLSGAELADMEFYQFHPTALSLSGAPRFLLSEALRGEGAILRNDRGERFMERYHPSLELAPRDVVARAIAREGMGPDPQHPRIVTLDMRHIQSVDLHKRFPGISAFLAQYHLDLHRDLIPVRPAAHYLMGGIRTDLHGRTSLPGLYAAGEAACTGVHGANRLASNSLLEGLVFGARAAHSMLTEGATAPPPRASVSAPSDLYSAEAAHVEAVIARLQRAMWNFAGLLRDAPGMQQGMSEVRACELSLEPLAIDRKLNRRFCEAQALCTVAGAILRAALAREESRGAHFRNDFPSRDDARYQKHSIDQRGNAIRFERWS